MPLAVRIEAAPLELVDDRLGWSQVVDPLALQPRVRSPFRAPDQPGTYEVRASVESAALFSHMYRDPTVTWEQLVALANAVERVAPASPAAWRRSPWRGPLAGVATFLEMIGRRLPGPMPQDVKSFIERTDPAA